MPKYGMNLENLFLSMNKRMPIESIIDIGVKVLESLEKIHRAGFIYGDLKLDNILFGYG